MISTPHHRLPTPPDRIGLRAATIAAALAAGAMLLPATAARAQDALGAGDVLDNNLNVSQGRSNRAAPQANYRARNLLVTGNVAGGRGFRGSVGYTAPFDFRGVAGSDDNYRFRANSAFSNPQYFRYGNTFQQVRFGQDLGLLEYSRRTIGTTPSTVLQDQATPGVTSRAQRQLDQMSLASSVPGATRRGTSPMMVGGIVNERQERLVIHSSSLQGVYASAEDASVGLIGLTPYDLARLREDKGAARLDFEPGREYETAFGLRRPEDRPRQPAPGAEDPGEESTRLDYRRVVDSITDRYREQMRPEPAGEMPPPPPGTPPGTPPATETPPAPTPPSLERLDASVRSLRERLRDALAERAAAPGATTTEEPAPTERPEPPPPPRSDVIPLSELAELLRHGQRLDRLAGAGEDRLNELIREGETHLRNGEYFRAERAFDHALRMTPLHPTAMAGLAHAQIGAGVNVSAAATVRTLFTEHPEMIDVRYDADLLPDADVLRSRQAALTERLDDARHAGDYGLLLAYIGHQIDDAEAIRSGLATMREVESDSALLNLLEDVWRVE